MVAACPRTGNVSNWFSFIRYSFTTQTVEAVLIRNTEIHTQLPLCQVYKEVSGGTDRAQAYISRSYEELDIQEVQISSLTP